MTAIQKIVVTGCNGFIGQHLCTFLRHKTPHTIVGLSRTDVDLSNAEDTLYKFKEISPNYIFHLAATGVSHERANDSSVIDENVLMLENVAESCHPGTILVIAGSMSEYGGAGIFKEKSPCRPTTAYGRAKLAVTQRALELAEERNLKVCIARLFGVYGPGENANRLFPSLLRDLRNNQIVALSDGLQKRDFIYVKDVCEFLWLLSNKLEAHSPLIVNLGTGKAVTIKSVCQWIADALSKPPEFLGFGIRERSPGDADILCANIDRLNYILNRVPQQRLHEALNINELFD